MTKPALQMSSTISNAAEPTKQQEFRNQPSRLTAWRLFVSRVTLITL
jgi:hypothetical protein